MSFIAVYITHDSELAAKKVANYLLDKKLIACANFFPINSAYWWQSAIQEEAEFVSLVKTTADLWDRLVAEVEKIHPYEVPCIVKYEVEANASYEAWIKNSVTTATL